MLTLAVWRESGSDGLKSLLLICSAMAATAAVGIILIALVRGELPKIGAAGVTAEAPIETATTVTQLDELMKSVDDHERRLTELEQQI